MTKRVGLWMLLAVVVSALATLLLWVGPVYASPAASPAVVSADPSVLRWAYAAAALATSISSIAASFAVARIGSAAVGAMAEKPELFGRVLVLVGLAEGIAIYGLIVSILILNRLG